MSGVMKITPENYTHVYGTCIITGKTVHYTKKKRWNKMVKDIIDYSHVDVECEKIDFTPFLDALHDNNFPLAFQFKMKFLQKYTYRDWCTIMDYLRNHKKESAVIGMVKGKHNKDTGKD